MLRYERQAKQRGFSCVIGIDEAGRGPLAGSVVAAAVELRSYRFSHRITDSKKLSPRQREAAFMEIVKHATIGVGIMNEYAIDHMNILQATRLAMEQAITQLMHAKKSKRIHKRKALCLIDGRVPVQIDYRCRHIVHGDNKSLSIAAASIVAKVLRDRMMDVYDKVYPRYRFSSHKGYGTKAHMRAVRSFGPCPLHRRTFEPIKSRVS